jgi:hypothetical protein
MVELTNFVACLFDTFPSRNIFRRFVFLDQPCNGFNKPGVVLGNHDASAELTDYDNLITDWVVGQNTNRCGTLNNLTRYGFGHSAFEHLVPQNEFVNGEMAPIEALLFEYFDIVFVHSHRFPR